MKNIETFIIHFDKLKVYLDGLGKLDHENKKMINIDKTETLIEDIKNKHISLEVDKKYTDQELYRYALQEYLYHASTDINIISKYNRLYQVKIIENFWSIEQYLENIINIKNDELFLSSLAMIKNENINLDNVLRSKIELKKKECIENMINKSDHKWLKWVIQGYEKVYTINWSHIRWYDLIRDLWSNGWMMKWNSVPSELSIKIKDYIWNHHRELQSKKNKKLQWKALDGILVWPSGNRVGLGMSWASTDIRFNIDWINNENKWLIARLIVDGYKDGITFNVKQTSPSKSMKKDRFLIYCDLNTIQYFTKKIQEYKWWDISTMKWSGDKSEFIFPFKNTDDINIRLDEIWWNEWLKRDKLNKSLLQIMQSMVDKT